MVGNGEGMASLLTICLSWECVLSGGLYWQAKALKSEDFGQLFSIQAFGSLTYRRGP